MHKKIYHLMLLCVLDLSVSSVRHDKKLLLVSFDGFRHDYLTLYKDQLKTLNAVKDQGVYVPQVMTTYATFTFPTHWTIVTGNYEESHGIVANKMYDRSLKETFTKSNHDQKWWNATKPIWTTAKQQGLKVATMFWPGSEVSFNGIQPDNFVFYDENFPFEKRVDKVIEWFKNGTNFCTLYFHEPDGTGHKFGVDSKEIQSILREVDQIVARLLSSLENSGLMDEVDVMITGDHGLITVPPKNVIVLNGTLDGLYELTTTSGAQLGIFSKPGKKQIIKEALTKHTQSDKYRVYLKEEIPAHLHYSNHIRIPDIVVLAKLGYAVFPNSSFAAKYLKGNRGMHGYDPKNSEMQTMLVAFGPSFKKFVKLKESFKQVDIYNVMCKLLEVEPQANNGSSNIYTSFLNSYSSQHEGLSTLLKVVLACIWMARVACNSYTRTLQL